MLLGYGEETGDDLAIVVEMDEDGDGGAFDNGDWNRSPKLKSLLLALDVWIADAVLLLLLLYEAELVIKLNEDNDEEDKDATVLAVVELDWLALLSSLSVKLLKLKLKLLRLDSSRLKADMLCWW